MIDLGASLNVEDTDFEYTPLMHAIVCKSEISAQLLINAGADVRAFGRNGRTAPSLAVELDLISVVKSIISLSNFDINERVVRPQGRLLLHEAAFRGNVRILKLLLESGADATLLDDECGFTPLAMAIACEKASVALSLIEAGVSVHDCCRNGLKPL